MRFVILMVCAVAAGALSMSVVPTTVVSSGVQELRQFRLADLNPLRVIFDSAQQQIQAGTTPEQLGLHSSSVTLTPMTLAPPVSLKLDLSRAYEAQAQSQIDQNIRHSQAMQAYTNNPSGWSGPPPN